MGAYRTPEGKPWILPVVKKAEKILAEKVNLIYWGGSNFEEDIFNIYERDIAVCIILFGLIVIVTFGHST